MREVVENPAEAERRGRQAAIDIRAGYSPDAAGETMERRLDQVRSLVEAGKPVRHLGPSMPTPLGLKALQELIAQGPVPREGGAARRLAQRVALRLMRPVIVHQRQVSERLVSEIEATRRRDAAHVAAVLAELRRQDECCRPSRRSSSVCARLEAENRSACASEGLGRTGVGTSGAWPPLTSRGRGQAAP